MTNVLQLSGYTYYWRREEFKDKNFTAAKQIGFIAQEIEALYPELVFTDAKTGYKAVDYVKMTPVLLEALKELNAKLETLKAETAGAKAEASAATTATAGLLRRVEALEALGARAGR